MFPLRMRFLAQYSKNWIIQISLLLFIQSVKIMRLTHFFTTRDVLNNFLDQNKANINMRITDGSLKYTRENGILYYLNEPAKNQYQGEIILFIGGRNSIIMNADFSERLSNHLSIPVATFQYGGLYKSGDNNGLSESSYMESTNKIYNMLSSKYNVHLVGYSIGCYGSYCINKKESIFLISPFYSLEETTRHIVHTKSFNLAEVMEKKPIKKIYVHSFYGDLINPIWHLKGPFKKPNVILTKHFGNHISGLSNILLDDIKEYLTESISNDQNIKIT